jgi:xylulokinase
VKSSYLIGIDAGVSFVKAGVYDLAGNPMAVAQNPSPGEYPSPGVFIQKNDDYLEAVVRALKAAVDSARVRPSDVMAVGMSSALGGATGIGRDWHTVFDWSIISDTRFNPYVTKARTAAGETIRRFSGTNFPVFAPKLLWWKTECPELYKKVRKFMFLCGFLVGRLCGIPIEDAYADRTFLQISSLADVEKGSWSDEICGALGIERELLPRVVRSHAVVGRLSREFAGACGLLSGTPFVAGAGDKPAGSIGAGLVVPGALVDESASFGALSLCVDSYVPDLRFETLENMPSPVEGHYFPCFFLFGSGVTHAWFRDNFGAEEKAQAGRTGGSAFELLDEKARGVPPGSQGLLSLGLLGGRGYPCDPDIRGMWAGHTWCHKREHFYRSLLESFAYEYACVLNVMRKNYPSLALDEVRVIGGGARSDLWNQIKADVLGLRYARLSRDDFALLGDVLIAGRGLGIYGDLKEAAQRYVKTTVYYEPDADRHKTYEKYVKYYGSLFDKVRGIFVDLKHIESGTWTST